MKKQANIFAAALLAALLLLLFPACGHEPVVKTVLVMDTVAQLTAVDGEAGAAVDERASHCCSVSTGSRARARRATPRASPPPRGQAHGWRSRPRSTRC